VGGSRPDPGAVVCVDGVFVPEAEARIPALDSGFLYGDGVFETVLVLEGRAVDAARHFARLAGAARSLGISLPRDVGGERELAGLARRLSAANGLAVGAAGFRASVSRGPRAPGPLSPPRGGPTLVASAFPVAAPRAPVAAAKVAIARNLVFSPSPSTRHKTLSSIHRVAGRFEAETRGLDEVVLADAAGRLAEACGHHLFLLGPDGVFFTPPLSLGILPGVTRGFLLSALPGRAAERDLGADDVARARAAFLTGALRGVWPVGTLEGRPLGTEEPERVRRLWIDSLESRSEEGA